jgi:hypothetical protein
MAHGSPMNAKAEIEFEQLLKALGDTYDSMKYWYDGPQYRKDTAWKQYLSMLEQCLNRYFDKVAQ